MVQRGFDTDAAFVRENMITFKIGGNGNAVFLVPEDRIRASSEFADAAMRGPWQESQERVIALPDFNRRTFGIYFQWLVTGVVHSKALRADEDPNICAIASLYAEILGLPELFNLGHYLLDTDFRDTLNDVLMQCASELSHFTSLIPPDYGSKFYEKTPDGSPTRKLYADLVAWTLEDCMLPYLSMGRELFDPDYTMDLLLAVTRRHVSRTPGKSPLDGWETSCKYHCHGDKKLCYRKKGETSSTVATATKRPAPDNVKLPDAKRRA